MGVYFGTLCYVLDGLVYSGGRVIAKADPSLEGELDGWRDDLIFEQLPLSPRGASCSSLLMLKPSDENEKYVVLKKDYFYGFLKRDSVIELRGQHVKTRSVTRSVVRREEDIDLYVDNDDAVASDIAIVELCDKNMVCVISPQYVCSLFFALEGRIGFVQSNYYSLLDKLKDNQAFQTSGLGKYLGFRYNDCIYECWDDVSFVPTRKRRKKKH